MNYYEDIYLKRVNRFGNSYSERLQGAREAQFRDFLGKTAYLVKFEYNDNTYVGALEPDKQDESKTLHRLLVENQIENIGCGSVLMLEDDNDIKNPYLVFYKEHKANKGYTAYVVLKLNQYISWKDRQGNIQETWVFFIGTHNGSARDALFKNGGLYQEPTKDNFFITSVNPNINKDDYFTFLVNGVRQNFRVVGYDVVTTPGIEYVTVDPIYEFDQTPPPQKSSTDKDEDFYWLEGGN